MVHLEEGFLLALSFSLAFKASLSKKGSSEEQEHICLEIFLALATFTK
jgi:hypothetical protein